ncbi:MAG TPA: hypothetical protein VL172_19270 [Kofleriaceae bacterium]|nr:hypothetical protein [Kofleriaceae bacterium]
MVRILMLCCVVAGCGPNAGVAADAAGTGNDADPADARPPGFTGNIYAHSYQNLYKVDPDTLDVMLIGPFGWPNGEDMMTDIAVDKNGDITGISFGAVYAVDHVTAACTYLAPLAGDQFNGLSFLPVGAIDQTDEEALVATGLGGGVFRINPMTGESTEIGDYGGIVESSGDIVSVSGFGTVATVKNGSTNDYLARVNLTTGEATMIGSTGYPDIWGVGFWKNKVYGFVATNQFVLIDVDTGVATYVSTGPENWTGAGVTTIAPIVP